MPGVERQLLGSDDGDDVLVEEVFPIVISAELSLRRGRRPTHIALQPSINYKVIVLLAPEKTRERLTLNASGEWVRAMP